MFDLWRKENEEAKISTNIIIDDKLSYIIIKMYVRFFFLYAYAEYHLFNYYYLTFNIKND